MALTKAEISVYEAKLKSESAARAAIPLDPKAKAEKVATLQAKWNGLASQETEIGDALAAGGKADPSLLSEIDRLKKETKAALAALGVIV